MNMTIKKMMMFICVLVSVIALTAFTSVVENESTAHVSVAKEGPAKEEQEFAEDTVDKNAIELARLMASQTDGVYSVAAVVIGKDLSVAVEVKQRKRFQLQGIRQEIFDKLKAEYPQHKVKVSTDRKIYRELEKLQRQAYEEGPDVQEIKQSLQKLNEDMNG